MIDREISLEFLNIQHTFVSIADNYWTLAQPVMTLLHFEDTEETLLAHCREFHYMMYEEDYYISLEGLLPL